MIRQIAASWLFAAFLVVVAVATWRVLDARRCACPGMIATPAPRSVHLPATPPLVVPPIQVVRIAPPRVEVVERAHTCGAGAGELDLDVER